MSRLTENLIMAIWAVAFGWWLGVKTIERNYAHIADQYAEERFTYIETLRRCQQNACDSSFTNLGQSFVAMRQGAQRFNFSRSMRIRIYADVRQAAMTGSIVLECDADGNFSSPTICARLGSPVVGKNLGPWVYPKDSACTAASTWCRFGMAGGNGIEDPVVRSAGVEIQVAPMAPDSK